MRLGVDMIKALRCKLRMMGTPLPEPCRVSCDNKGLVDSTSTPESVSKKKHDAINWHIIREACAMAMIEIGKERTDSDLADILTKAVKTDTRWKLLYNILWPY